jgi:hypothetical protein
MDSSCNKFNYKNSSIRSGLIVLVLMISLVANGLPVNSSSDAYDSGYKHGCDDARLDPSDRYINEAGKGPEFHTRAFMEGYDAGLSACSDGGGLRLFVYVHKPTASFANGQEADVTVTSQGYDKFKKVVVPDGYKTFYVEFEYAPNQVEIGDKIVGCAHVGGLDGCANTYNSKEKIPEHIDIYLSPISSSSSGSRGSSSASSSSSSGAVP